MKGENGAYAWAGVARTALRTVTRAADDRGDEIAKLRELNDRAAEALVFCSGASDFAEGGVAREGWLRLGRPLIVDLALEHGKR